MDGQEAEKKTDRRSFLKGAAVTLAAAAPVTFAYSAIVQERSENRPPDDPPSIAASDNNLGIVSATDFDAVNDGSEDATEALQALADSLPDTGAWVVIPPGSYRLSGTVGFRTTLLTICAQGCSFIQEATDAPCFDLNKNAQRDETGRTHNVRWYGGFFESSSEPADNANVGIRVRGVTRGEIASVHSTKMGGGLIEYSAIDGFHLSDVHGFNNGYHIRIPEYSTIPGNPQSYSISNCGFGRHLYAGISVEKMVNNLTIENSYFTGKDCIVASTGNETVFSRNLIIDKCTFEQAEANEYVIRTQNPKGQVMRNLTIRSCDFNDAPSKVLDAVAVDGLHIDDCNIVSKSDGMIHLDSECKSVEVGSTNAFVGLSAVTQAISHSCPRSEISLSKEQHLQTPAAIANWNGHSKSTSNGTIDMSSSAASSWPKLLPPRAWLINARVEDSGSSDSLVRLVLTANSTDELSTAPTALIEGVPDGKRRHFQFVVPANSEGDIYYDVIASDTDAMKVVLSVAGRIM